jgi:hypothetical protein
MNVPGRHVFRKRNICNHYPASTSVRAAYAECNAPPSCVTATRLGRASHFSPITSHLSHLAPRLRYPLKALIFLPNVANAGKGEMKADYSCTRSRELFEDNLAG